MKELIEKMTAAHEQYWSTGTSSMSDTEWDTCVKQLQELDPNHQLITKMGARGTFKHPEPMLSLDKAYAVDEVLKFMKNTNDTTYIVQPKYDGVCARIDDYGIFTRGDGEYGEDITRHVYAMKEAKLNLTGATYAELIITKDDFDRYGEGYKTPRNMIAGILNNKEAEKRQLITLCPHNETSYDLASHATAFDIEALIKSIKDLCDTKGIPVDGVVFKVKDLTIRKALGSTNHHPRWAIAFKFANEQATTTIKDITWQHGMFKLTPVLEIEPVEVGGVTISRLTGHNMQFLIDNKITIGAEILIERAGDVIPTFVRTLTESSKDSGQPACCYACGSSVKWVSTVDIDCTNDSCPERVKAKLEHALRIMGTKNIGPATISALVDSGIDSVPKLMRVTEADFIAAGLTSVKVNKKCLEEINKARTQPYYNYFAICALQGVGRTVGKLLEQAGALYTLMSMLDSLAHNTKIDVKGIGTETKTTIFEALTHYNDDMRAIRDSFEWVKTESSESQKTVCFTGKMTHSRSTMEASAQAKGFKAVSGVTKTLTYLVTSEPDRVSTKTEKAKKLGIPIIGVDEWFAIGN